MFFKYKMLSWFYGEKKTNLIDLTNIILFQYLYIYHYNVLIRQVWTPQQLILQPKYTYVQLELYINVYEALFLPLKYHTPNLCFIRWSEALGLLGWTVKNIPWIAVAQAHQLLVLGQVI